MTEVKDEGRAAAPARAEGRGAEEQAAPAETSTYTVKEGYQIEVIDKGVVKVVSGGGTVELTPDQAASFNDATIEEAPPHEDVATWPVGETIGDTTTIVEANAKIGSAQGLEGETPPAEGDDVKASPSDEPELHPTSDANPAPKDEVRGPAGKAAVASKAADQPKRN